MTKKSQTILIVEDEKPLIRALCDKFRHEGFNVLEARNGAEGLEVALREHPDLILLDIIMPVMDGVSMFKKLREDEWGKSVPVIMLTNLIYNEKIAEAIMQGSHEYLVKSDFKLEDVVAKVRERLAMPHN